MIRREFICYAAIGLALTAILYGAYLALTYAGVPSLAAMTLTYSAGMAGGFLLNRNITFRYRGNNSGALLRYLASYAIGYSINFVALWLLSVRAGLPHQIVQGFIVLSLPMILFALQRCWVFRPGPQVDSLLTIR